ncbi:glycosyltransferase family 15 protein [Athelia psychrophila]|uniref:Glycosyltransferase family 15 protein n=1 Tax=Athelia psychrophila TaxID=1759441 RepID=A0A166SSS4_9AGAM|nr:glycosyltransferase family 15 protein [Fibularhizoctonia sp. CBS 109695]
MGSRRIWAITSEPAQPYTAAILYLTRSSRSSELIDSLSSLHNFVPGPAWPIILMHTGDYDDEEAQIDFVSDLRTHIGTENGSWTFAERVEFLKLDWSFPAGVSHDIDVVDPVMPNVWPGYHQMCAFFTAPIFDLPRLKAVTYYMRLDTDSLITAPLCYDPFEVMYTRQRSYGYLGISNDIDEVTIGVRGLVHDYAGAHPDVKERMDRNGWAWPHENDEGEMITPPIRGYNNNFEIVKLATFHRPDVRQWLEDLTSVPERWYKYRWGDGPLRLVTTSMFLEEKDLEVFCGMHYYHQYNAKIQCPCVPL